MSVINTNVSALTGLNNLRITNVGLRTSLERLSSGLKINHAADDPSGLAIAEGMNAQIHGTRVAMQNGEDAINLIHTADGALAETHDILIRMRDLAVRASNEAPLTTDDRTRLNDELTELKEELVRKANALTFNRQHLFSGGMSGQMIQIGPDNKNSNRLTIVVPQMNALAAAATVDTPANANNAISIVQAAIDTVSDVRASLGVQERRIRHVIDDLSIADINTSAAKSRIMDADMAAEITEFTRLQILQQSGTAILAQANAQPQSVLQLLQ